MLQRPDKAGAERAGRERAGKILPLDQLGPAIEAVRKGRRVVLCHGVFDLLHVGHLRHLKAARDFGDLLVVTITGDEFVNKGPGRPAFPSTLRAEMLAELEVVDFVGVVEEAGAHPAIRTIKPDFLVKGSEYSDPAKDISGKIVTERELVESFGGQLVFTEDITFSSSNLLNRYFNLHDQPAREYLAGLRQTDFESRFNRLLDRIEKMRIVVVGETIVDHYVYVDAMGKAAKENIIATLYRDEEVFAGGVIAVANNLSAICPNVELITMVGDPGAGNNHADMIRKSLAPSVKATFLHKPSAPTVQKTRFVEPTYVRKLFEIYRMDDTALPANVQAFFHTTLEEKLARSDLAVVCDFGHGMIDAGAVDILQRKAPFLAVNVQSNAGNIGYNLIDKYRRCDFMCVDAMEARLAVRDKHAALADIVTRRLPRLVDCNNFIVTHGRSGCFVRKGDGALCIPSFGGAVVDTVGAGDAFFALSAPCVAAGADCEMAGFVGNVAGAIKIGIVGHRRYLSRFEIQRYVTTLLK
ncbi:MAG: adenylyltransferase/cytidyltransferase family protein [Pseudorhodoplanes sp.]|nr:adenylyltransferase/cytidyltransferase family protein [Pseudorhodoplanes sp.]